MRNTYFARLTCLSAAVKFILPTVCSKKGFFLSSWLFTNRDGGSRGGKKMAIAAFKSCFQEILLCKQLLITEFEVGTVSQGPIFCLSDFKYGPSANRIIRGSVTYTSGWENEASKIFIISLRLQFTQNFAFSGLYSEIWPAKLTDHSARSSWEI